MPAEYPLTKENKVRQLKEKAAYDRDTVYRILDAGLMAHVAFIQDGAPVVVPMIYGREGDTIDGRYRVLKIGTESAELSYVDGRGRQTLRLSGQ